MKSLWKGTTALLLTASMTICGLSGIQANPGKASAATGVPSICTGFANLANPSAGSDAWEGNYIYYGARETTALKWRVLDTTGTAGNSSVAGGILLQADSSVGTSAYENINTWLNDSQDGFLKGFGPQEQQNILESTVTASQQSPTDLLTSTSLTGEQVFLLDAADLATDAYGYRYENGTSNCSINSNSIWWLRSPYKTEGKGVQGCVLPNGTIFYSLAEEEGQIVPAMNIDASKILFTSATSLDKTAAPAAIADIDNSDWKFTLLDPSLSAAAGNSPEDTWNGVSRADSIVTVPYSLVDENQTANQLSLMITNGDYPNAAILHYGKVADVSGSTESEFSFTLPADFDENTQKVYLIPEQVNPGQQTDYAGQPVLVPIPPRHIHNFSETWSYDDDCHWHDCIENGTPCDGSVADFEEHDLDTEDVQEATCQQPGYYYDYCTICGWRSEMQEDEMADHEPAEDEEGEYIGTWIKQPTCEEDGILQFNCQWCGLVSTMEDGQLEHEYEEKTIEPTCDKDGAVVYTCKYCGDSYQEPIPKLKHEFGKWTVVTPATETTKGVEKRTCSKCGKEETRDIPVTAHVHDYHKDTWIASETEHWHACSCGKKSNLGTHEFMVNKILTESTTSEEGKIEYICKQCNYKKTYTLPVLNKVFEYDGYRYKYTGEEKKTPAVKVMGIASGSSAKTIKFPTQIYTKSKSAKPDENSVTSGEGVALQVTSIASRAFIRNKTVEKLIIPNTVHTIGGSAFFNCRKLKQITLGTGVKKINMHAFCHLAALKSFEINSSKLQKKRVDFFHESHKCKIRIPKKCKKTYQKLFEEYATKIKTI